MAAAHAEDKYHLPHGTNWPILGSIALFTLFLGVSILLNGSSVGQWPIFAGFALLLYMMFRWFGQVIGESDGGLYNLQVDKSFRMGMGWFIFSEVMFFAVFFGALFYARQLSLPWLGGEGSDVWTNLLLWPDFENTWPTNGPGKVGGAFEQMGPLPIPAHEYGIPAHERRDADHRPPRSQGGNRGVLKFWLAATFLLGFIFLGFQAYEYTQAFNELNLTMKSGIYGTTFFMLTGFHGFHVTIGAIMLTVIWLRVMKGHFTPDHHFAFEGVAWYWHFVDVVWLGLFIFVYWL